MAYLLLGALLLGALSFSSAQTGYRVDAQQRFEGLQVSDFNQGLFLTAVTGYFQLDADLVREGAGVGCITSRRAALDLTMTSPPHPPQCYVNNVYYADGSTVVVYTCYFRASTS